jgi:hypothetical protein
MTRPRAYRHTATFPGRSGLGRRNNCRSPPFMTNHSDANEINKRVAQHQPPSLHFQGKNSL